MSERIDTAAIMAQHYSHAGSCEFAFLTKQPGTCETYRLAKAVASLQAKVARVDELRNECWQGVTVNLAANMSGPNLDAGLLAQRLDAALSDQPEVSP